MASEVIFDVPDKSFSDKKNYKVIRLPNKLTVLLVSNPLDISSENHKLAAVVLSVNVGAFSDPKNIKGLSHFLEHMIFMGSEKYPNEDEFMSFVLNNGGLTNAVTEYEETTFFFKIQESLLEGAADRFSQLFFAPLLKHDAMMREREAVDSEFSSNLINSDKSRIFQLLVSMTNPNHPVNAFPCGNLKTLKDNIEDEKLYQKLHDYRRRHYSANRMYLCVEATRPLDELEIFARQYFSGIPNNDLPSDDFSQFNHENALSPVFSNRIFFLKPVTNLCKIDMTWLLPSMESKFKTKPLEFLKKLFIFEDDGSLLAYLRKKLWVMSFDVDSDDTSICTVFRIEINLTEEGFANVKKVVSAVYSYLKLLISVNANFEGIFKEIQFAADVDFKYDFQSNSVMDILQLAKNLRKYPPKYVLSGPKLYFEYDDNEIRSLANTLNTIKCNLLIISSIPYPNVVYDQKEDWHGSEYTSWDMPDDWKRLYEDAELLDEFYLPEQNEFITTDFTILYQDDPTKYNTEPENLLNNDFCELWFKPDYKFRTPKAIMKFILISSMAVKNCFNQVQLDLYENLLKFHLSKKISLMKRVGLSCEISQDHGLIINISGYNQNLNSIANIITKEMVTFIENLSEEEFSNMKQKIIQEHYSSLLSPARLISEIRNGIEMKYYWTIYDKYSQLQEAKLEDLKWFVGEYFKELKIRALIQGNLLRETAQESMNIFLRNLNCGKIEHDVDLIKQKIIQFPHGDHYLCVKSFNKNDSNTIVLNTFQIGLNTVPNCCMLDLLKELMWLPFFNQLRTNEQLSYYVSANVLQMTNVLSFGMVVNPQEDKFPAEYVDSRIELFLRKFLTTLQEMSDEEFNTSRDSLVKGKLKVDDQLRDEHSRNWKEIINDDYKFDRLQVEADYLKGVLRQNMVDFYKNNLLENIRKITCFVRGNISAVDDSSTTTNDTLQTSFALQYDEKCSESNAIENEMNVITNIQNFKTGLFIYPPEKDLLPNQNDS